MKTAGEEDPNSHVRLHTEPSPWDGKSEPSSLIHRGWKVRKYPAAAGVFFLTFPFIEPSSLIHRGSELRKYPAAAGVFFLTFPFIERSSLIHRGWKVRKYPAAAGVFFLTFPFIELLGTNLAVAGPDYFRLADKLPKRWVRL